MEEDASGVEEVQPAVPCLMSRTCSPQESECWQDEALGSGQRHPPQIPGLAGELYRTGFSSLPWIHLDTAPPVVSLRQLGEGTSGWLDLVDFAGEVLARKGQPGRGVRRGHAAGRGRHSFGSR